MDTKARTANACLKKCLIIYAKFRVNLLREKKSSRKKTKNAKNCENVRGFQEISHPSFRKKGLQSRKENVRESFRSLETLLTRYGNSDFSIHA